MPGNAALDEYPCGLLLLLGVEQADGLGHQLGLHPAMPQLPGERPAGQAAAAVA